MARIPASAWWSSLDGAFQGACKPFIAKAQQAERDEKGHDCGHEWTVTIESRAHSSGIYGEPDSPHSDANWTDNSGPVTVRAHNLRDALLVAAALPLDDWFPDDDPAPDAVPSGEATDDAPTKEA